MNLPRQLIERKLTEALGAAVEFEALSASVLAGSIEARGVRIAGARARGVGGAGVAGAGVAGAGAGDEDALLTVRRIVAEVSLGQALQKKIVVRALRVEGLRLDLARDPRGEWNLPARRKRATAPVEISRGGDDDSPAWEFAVESISLVDCELRVSVQADYALAARRIVGELKQEADGISLVLLAAGVGRMAPGSMGTGPTELEVDLGELRVSGKFDAAGKLQDVPAAPLAAEIEVGDVLKGAVESPSVRSGEISVELSGAMGAAILLDLLPAGIAGLDRLARTGRAEVKLRASRSPASGLRISEASVRVIDIAAPARSPAPPASPPARAGGQAAGRIDDPR
jgi:hypothetical protein